MLPLTPDHYAARGFVQKKKAKFVMFAKRNSRPCNDQFLFICAGGTRLGSKSSFEFR